MLQNSIDCCKPAAYHVGNESSQQAAFALAQFDPFCGELVILSPQHFRASMKRNAEALEVESEFYVEPVAHAGVASVPRDPETAQAPVQCGTSQSCDADFGGRAAPEVQPLRSWFVSYRQGRHSALLRPPPLREASRWAPLFWCAAG